MRLLILSAALVFTACASNKPKPTGEPTESPPMEETSAAEGAADSSTVSVNATLEPKSGTSTSGTANFTQSDGKVTLALTVENAPEGTHAVHLHETGDCSAEDATSAGGHWNPTGSQHGRFGENGFHLGDIGNLEVAADGTGKLTFSTDHWSIGTGEDNDITGKAIIVHAGSDDFMTQPTGNAGGRIACGVLSAE